MEGPQVLIHCHINLRFHQANQAPNTTPSFSKTLPKHQRNRSYQSNQTKPPHHAPLAPSASVLDLSAKCLTASNFTEIQLQQPRCDLHLPRQPRRALCGQQPLRLTDKPNVRRPPRGDRRAETATAGTAYLPFAVVDGGVLLVSTGLQQVLELPPPSSQFISSEQMCSTCHKSTAYLRTCHVYV